MDRELPSIAAVSQLVVQSLYSSWAERDLEDLLEVGRKFVPSPTVRAMNQAIADELQRRKAEREDGSHE